MKPKDMNLKTGDVIEWLGIERTVMEEPDYHTDGGVHLTLSYYGTGIFTDQDFTLIHRANQSVKIGDKIKSDKYRSNPVGIYTVLHIDKDGDICAKYDDEPDDCFEWFFYASEYIPHTPTPDTPRTWGELTNAEKGALLLANHEGKVIQSSKDGIKWVGCLFFGDNFYYRIKPEPAVKTVEYYWRTGHPTPVLNRNDHHTHTITFDTIDGIPDMSSIRMVDNGW